MRKCMTDVELRHSGSYGGSASHNPKRKRGATDATFTLRVTIRSDNQVQRLSVAI